MTANNSEKVEVLSQNLMIAWRNYDIWWVYKSADTRPLYAEVMDRFQWFFEASVHAHFVAMLMALSRLLDRDTRSVSVRSMPSGGVAGEHALEQASRLWAKLKIVRDKAIAHSSARLNWEQAFKAANMKYDEVYELLEATTQVVNDVLRAEGKIKLERPTEMRADLIQMLDALKRADKADSP